MSAAPKIIDKKTLQILVPFNALSPMHFNEVAQKTVVEEVRAGRLIFKEGERDNQSVYLLEGEISLVAGNEIVGAITAGSDAARHPIAQQQPRQVSARAKSNVMVARVDSSLLDIMLTWDQSSGYEVAEISEDDDDDWMTRILQSQAFLKLPPSNIQRLLMRVESIPVSAGEVIIRQGGDGDYFYIIKNGRCMVTRRPSPNAKEVKLAELADGDAFGEDALVSDAKRNATITMMTDGVLMRLAKKDFVELLKEPLLAKLSYQEAAAKVAKGAEWLDVRLPGEYENVHIRGSRNIPLSALRLEANGLNPAVKYIVCCDTGRRSASAAFVLSQRGFEVFVLNDGLAAVPADAQEGNTVSAAVAPTAESADVVALKPHGSTPDQSAQAAPDDRERAALQQRVEALQQEKQALEAAQQQLGGRIGGLQEELTRVRDESREQILELEQILADVRRDHAAARAELQAAQEALGAQRETAGSVREHTESMHRELAERSAREDRLQGEITGLQARLDELEAARHKERRQAESDAAERTRLQARIDELEALTGQIEAQRTQIEALESALQTATRHSEQTASQHGEQAQRLGELEAALQVATAALQRADEENERRLAELAAAHADALAHAQTEAAERQTALQARLDEVAARHADSEARAADAAEREQALAAEQQALRDTVAALRAQLETERGLLAEQRACAERDAEELNQLREAQPALEDVRREAGQLRAELEAQHNAHAALRAEREASERAIEDAARVQAELEQRLHAAQASVEALQADSSTQVQRLQAELDAVCDQQSATTADYRALEAAHATLLSERDALQTALAEVRSAQEAALAETAAQVQQLQTELRALREQAVVTADEHTVLSAAQAALETERTALQSALDEARNQIEALRTGADEQVLRLQGLLDETQGQLHRETQAHTAVAEEFAAAQLRAAELDSALQAQTAAAAQLQERLHAAEQALSAAATGQEELQRAQSADREALAELRAELGAQQEARAADEQQIGLLEQHLADQQAEAVRLQQDHQAALVALQAELAAAEQARVELLQQQADTASGQDQQIRQLADLREDLRAAQARLQAADAARDEIEGRLAEMSDAAVNARTALEQSEQAHALALADAEQQVRATLERQIEELRSELDGARAALAREQSQRSNLEQAQQAEFAAAQAQINERLGQAEREVLDSRQALAAAEAARQELETRLAAERAAAADQQQALQMELEQLRSVTTADLTAMQQRLQQLQDDLQAARRLGAGGSADEEIDRLRLLLDEAREAADGARADAEQWREQATSAPAEADADAARQVADELAAMNIQLADAQSRVAEALQLRDAAEQELALLRQRPQAQPAVTASLPTAPDAPKGRAGVWLGLVAGLLAGGLGTAAALWFGTGVSTPAADTPAATTSEHRPSPEAPAAEKPISSPPIVAAQPVARSTSSVASDSVVRKGRSLHDTLSDGTRGPQLIEIAAAEFSMGSSANSLDFDERPRHNVKLQRFAISQHEITFAEFDAFARATGRRLPDDKGWGRDRQPVINVSWEDAVAYTQWLSQQTGRRYRLPTEAEWEYVAGGFAGTLYWWGNMPGDGRANCFNCASEWDSKSPAPVASFAANPLGVFDTAGNVAEWVQDCYHAGYDGAPADGGAWVEVGCARRVVRGGGFNSPANTLRTAKRDQQPANMRADDVGFRVVREL